MPRALVLYVRWVEALNYRIGRMAMYLLFVLAGVLLWSTIAKAFFRPPLWTQEMAQFTMVGYFVLGGAYALQMGANVRMDLIYTRSEPAPPRDGRCRHGAGDDLLPVGGSGMGASTARFTRWTLASARAPSGAPTWRRSRS